MKAEMKQLAEIIKEADLVLVGIGEELDLSRRGNPSKEQGNKLLKEWMLPFIQRDGIRQAKGEMADFYAQLGRCLEGRNYFIVSLCEDQIIREYGFKQDRIVFPCGGFTKMQCMDKCTQELFPVPEELEDRVLEWKKESGGEEPAEPLCPYCHKPLVFNRVEAPSYVEEGYLEQWGSYRKWLQGTVNKKLCVLELGAGMTFPTVIRWPFEKVVFFNQKASLIRVHGMLGQVTEEIAGRAYGFCRDPKEFMKELCDCF